MVTRPAARAFRSGLPDAGGRSRAADLRKREEIGAGSRSASWISLSLRLAHPVRLGGRSHHIRKFGLVYVHPCLQVIAGVERLNTNDRDAEDTTTFSFRVTLKNLGEIGTDADLMGGRLAIAGTILMRRC